MGWWHGRYHRLGMDALANGWAGSMDMARCRPELQQMRGKRGRWSLSLVIQITAIGLYVVCNSFLLKSAEGR